MFEKTCHDCGTGLEVPFGVLVNVELDMRMRGDDGTACYVCSACEAAIQKAESEADE
jgi:hypothetical protein